MKLGTYYYPGRLIFHDEKNGQWLIRLWRGCILETPGPMAGSNTLVPVSDVVDCLWRDQQARRKVRVSTTYL